MVNFQEAGLVCTWGALDVLQGWAFTCRAARPERRGSWFRVWAGSVGPSIEGFRVRLHFGDQQQRSMRYRRYPYGNVSCLQTDSDTCKLSTQGYALLA